MSEYVVMSDRTELARGSYFTTLPGPVKPGDLVLLEIGGVSQDWLIVGRWFPEIAGCDWILTPGFWIQCTGAVPVRVIGVVVPCEDPPKQTTNLPADEYERFLGNSFPRFLDS